MTNQHETPEALAHALFTAAQLAPGEGIEDAVGRLAALVDAQQPSPTLQADSQPAPVWDYPPLPDFDTVEQHIYGACRRYITQDMLEPIHNLIRDVIDADRAARDPAESVGRDAPAAGAVAGKWPVGWSVSRAGDAWTVVAPDGQRRVWHEKTTSHDDSVFMWTFLEALNGPRPSPTDWAAVSNPAYEELPDSLICAVDQWFADNIKDSDGCTTQDVSELAEIFYGVTHEGGRESVDDALAIVKSFGPGIGGINDTYARQVLLAEEVERLRGQATNAKKTGELLMGLAVIRELTGTQQKGLEETIEAVRAAVSAQKHPPAPAIPAVNDDLRDRLVAISEAVAYQDDRAAQAMLREILKAPQAESRPAPAPALLTDEELCQIEEPYLLNFRIPLGGQYDFARAVEKAVICKMGKAQAPQGETNVQLDIDSNHSAPGQQRDVARAVALGQPMGNGQDQAAGHLGAQGDKLLTVAERNIRIFLRSATFKSESDREAALNCVDVLWAAARDPADSVLEDAARLDWLESNSQTNIERVRYLGATKSIYEVTPYDSVSYDGETLRAAIDAARKQGGAI